MSLGGKVAIVGSGVIKYGENFHQSLTDMIYEAVTQALADARMERQRLEAAWLGCYEPMLYGFEGNSGAFVSDPLNLFPIPVTRVAAYCATGIEAVRNAALAAVAVKNHYHGSLNPKAHFQKEITPEQHRRAPKVAEPLGLFDCCPTTDGAAAVVLARADLAPKLTDTYTILRGVAFAVTAGYWNTQFDPSWSFTSFPSTQEAAKAAYRMSGVTNPAKEIKVAECHDCFTITEIVNYEDLGFARPGEGWKWATGGVTKLGGDLPVNTSGGLKSCGHPIGSSGVPVKPKHSPQ